MPTKAVVADTILKSFHSSEFVRGRVEEHFMDPLFFSDTLHFYKVSDYHMDLREAVKKAN